MRIWPGLKLIIPLKIQRQTIKSDETGRVIILDALVR